MTFLKTTRKTFVSYLFASALMAGVFAPAVQAETLSEAMLRAYNSNPEILAAREAYKAVYFGIPEAQSGYKPNIDTRASQSWVRRDSDLKGGGNQDTRLSSRDFGVQITQPLYRGGRTVAGIAEAEHLYEAQRYALYGKEQNIFTQVVESYFNLNEAVAILSLREKNVAVLSEQLEATKQRFEVGELTRTDVSQAESRLARAQAEEINARGLFEQRKAVYERVIGTVRSDNEFSNDVILSLPTAVGEVVDLALNNHPDIFVARLNSEAAKESIDRVRGELLPEINAVGSAFKLYNPSSTIDETDEFTIGVNLTFPLYEGGATRARAKRAEKVANQRTIEVQDSQRIVRQRAIETWNAYVANKAQIKAIEAQIQSADIALEGVKEEAQVGARTILDILDAEQEALDARVSLVSAQRNLAISQFALLAAAGKLSVENLNLK